MLNDNDILVRRVRYGCCALSLGAEVATAQTYGDVECAKRLTRSWLYMIWAKSIMDAVPVGDEDTDCGDVAFATAVAAVADCICTSCTGPGGSAPYNGGGGGGGDTSCEIIVSRTVIDAVTISDRAAIQGAGPTTGDAYLIISGSTDGVWTANTIQTWNGSSWTQSAVVAGEIIATEEVPNPSYWLTPQGQPLPGNLFPFIDIDWGTGTTIYTVQSQYPYINAYMGRSIVIYATNGIVTTNVYIGPETAIINPLALNIGGLGATGLGLTYFLDNCEWPAGSELIPPTECVFPRDHNCEDHNSLDHS